ncbi:MAG: DUF4426 domain-containing protein [Cellvibrionaceae bacterium]
MLKFFSLLLAMLFSSMSFSQEDSFTRFDDMTVHHSVFSSTSVLPKIASQLGIIRGKNYVLINIALTENDSTDGGKPAIVSGTAANLLQQVKKLDFKEISEATATYYIASLRVTEEEVFHFKINVAPKDKIDDSSQDNNYEIKFTKTLYVNE